MFEISSYRESILTGDIVGLFSSVEVLLKLVVMNIDWVIYLFCWFFLVVFSYFGISVWWKLVEGFI